MRAGLPATIVFGGTSFVTRLPAPTMAFSPTVMPPSSVAPEPIEAPRLISVFWQNQSVSVCNWPVGTGGSRIAVVDKSYSVTHEDFGFNCHTLANEGVTANLATIADTRALLNFNECADLRFVADLAAVQVHERENLHIPSQFDVGRNALEVRKLVIHREIDSACTNSLRSNEGIGSYGRANVTGAPRSSSDAEAASRILTSSRP